MLMIIGSLANIKAWAINETDKFYDMKQISFMIFSELMISAMFPIMIWRCLHGWCDGWTLESGVTTFHPIHHPVMDMGSGSLTAEGGGGVGWRWWTVQMGLSAGPDRDAGCDGRRVNAQTCVRYWKQGYTVCKCVLHLILHVCSVATIISIFFFSTDTTWSKDDSRRGSLCFDSLSGAHWCCSTLCGQWTRTLQLTVSSEATLRGKDATHPRKCNQERWMGWATFDPAIRTAVSIILSHHSVHDGVIICFSLSDPHAVVSRRSVPLLLR